MQQFQDDLMQLRVHLAELKKNLEDRISRLEERVKMLEEGTGNRTNRSVSQGTGNDPVQNLPE